MAGHRGPELCNSPLGRRALSVLWGMVVVALLSIGLAGASRAVDCGNWGVCPGTNKCAPIGSSCCSDGEPYWRPGSACWGNGSSQWCPTGYTGYKDGGCAPSNISALSYCGNSRWCTNGRDTCWTVYVSAGTCCPTL